MPFPRAQSFSQGTFRAKFPYWELLWMLSKKSSESKAQSLSHLAGGTLGAYVFDHRVRCESSPLNVTRNTNVTRSQMAEVYSNIWLTALLQ